VCDGSAGHGRSGHNTWMVRDQGGASGARPDSEPLDRLNRFEARLLRRLTPDRRPSEVVSVASTSARGSRLWLLIAAGLALRPGVCRRAALHAVTAIAMAAAGSHLVGKAFVRRRRPYAEHLPALPAQKPPHQLNTSSSFPSAHAASAAAFATAVALESAPLGAAVTPLALLVAYSRLRTLAHWPTDVVAGLLLGVLAAATARAGLKRLPISTHHD